MKFEMITFVKVPVRAYSSRTKACIEHIAPAGHETRQFDYSSISAVLADSWEPCGCSPEGRIMFKRPIP